MNPKEKAEELVGKYYFQVQTLEQQKQCALIAVNEIINNNTKIPANVNGLHTVENTYYWQQVKEEIEIL